MKSSRERARAAEEDRKRQKEAQEAERKKGEAAAKEERRRAKEQEARERAAAKEHAKEIAREKERAAKAEKEARPAPTAASQSATLTSNDSSSATSPRGGHHRSHSRGGGGGGGSAALPSPTLEISPKRKQFAIPLSQAFVNHRYNLANPIGTDEGKLREISSDLSQGDLLCPAVLTKSIEFISSDGLEEEGIFRLSGTHDVIQKYKHDFDCGVQDPYIDCYDPNNVTGVLKLWFRDLPEPVFTHKLGKLFRNLRESDVRFTLLSSFYLSLSLTIAFL